MGAGIAIVCARAGFRTVVFDTRQQALDQAREQTRGFFEKSVQRGKLPADELPQIIGRLEYVTDPQALAGCDLIIEAVFEDLAVKHRLFSALHAVCGEHTIFASNT